MNATRALPAAFVLALVLCLATPAALAQDGGLDDYEVHLERDHADAGPQESVDLPIVVENHGQARLRVTFELADPEGPPQGFHVVVPPPVELGPAEGGEPSTSRSMLAVHTPFQNGYVDESAEIPIRVQAHDAEDPDRRGDPTTVNVTVTAQGFHVPGPGSLAASAAVAAAAWMARRRRDP